MSVATCPPRKVSHSTAQDLGRNISRGEQLASLVAGVALIPVGIGSRSWGRIISLATGAALIQRGWTGQCSMYRMLGINTREPHDQVAIPAQQGVKVEETVFINRPADELFAHWRQLENLPKFMSHLKSVTVRADRTSHWVAVAPFGVPLEWDAEDINLREGEMIAWRSLPGSQVDTAGSVHFTPLPGHGTRVTVTLKYDPPGGKVSDAIAHFFGMGLQDTVRADLQRFKEMMEAGQTVQARSPVASVSAGQ